MPKTINADSNATELTTSMPVPLTGEDANAPDLEAVAQTVLNNVLLLKKMIDELGGGTVPDELELVSAELDMSANGYHSFALHVNHPRMLVRRVFLLNGGDAEIKITGYQNASADDSIPIGQIPGEISDRCYEGLFTPANGHSDDAPPWLYRSKNGRNELYVEAVRQGETPGNTNVKVVFICEPF